jgi:hypothetical protein
MRQEKRMCAYGFIGASIALGSASEARAGFMRNMWMGAESGLWHDGENWSLGAPPERFSGSMRDAVISAKGKPYVIWLDADAAVGDLTLASRFATLAHSSGVLDLEGTMWLEAGDYLLAGGTIRGGVINVAGGRLLFKDRTVSTFDGATLRGGELLVQRGNDLVIGSGGLAIDSTLRFEGQSDLALYGDVTGSGQLVYGDLTDFDIHGDVLIDVTSVSAGYRSALNLKSGSLLRISSNGSLVSGWVDSVGGSQFINEGHFKTRDIRVGVSRFENHGVVESSRNNFSIAVVAESWLNTGEIHDAKTLSGAWENHGDIHLWYDSLLDGSWTGTGRLLVGDGNEVDLAGSFDTDGANMIDAGAGSIVHVMGLWDNTDGTIDTSALGGHWRFERGAVVSGGNLRIGSDVSHTYLEGAFDDVYVYGDTLQIGSGEILGLTGGGVHLETGELILNDGDLAFSGNTTLQDTMVRSTGQLSEFIVWYAGDIEFLNVSFEGSFKTFGTAQGPAPLRALLRDVTLQDGASIELSDKFDAVHARNLVLGAGAYLDAGGSEFLQEGGFVTLSAGARLRLGGEDVDLDWMIGQSAEVEIGGVTSTLRLSDPSHWSLTDSVIEFSGDLDNSSGTLVMPSGGNRFAISGAVRGGNIDLDDTTVDVRGTSGLLEDVRFLGGPIMFDSGSMSASRITLGGQITVDGGRLDILDNVDTLTFAPSFTQLDFALYAPRTTTYLHSTHIGAGGLLATSDAEMYLRGELVNDGVIRSLARNSGNEYVHYRVDLDWTGSVVNNGLIESPTGGLWIEAPLRNNGVIEASGDGQLWLENLSNYGIIRSRGAGEIAISGLQSFAGSRVIAEGGLIQIFLDDGPVTTDWLYGMTSSGGEIRVHGDIDNSGRDEDLSAMAGPVSIDGSITGGTLRFSGNRRIVGDNATFDGVTVVADSIVFGHSGEHIQFINGSTLGGADLVFQEKASLVWGDAGATVDINGWNITADIDAPNTGSNALISAKGFTVASGSSIRGRGLTVSAVGGSIVNDGTIEGDGGFAPIKIEAAAFTNNGEVSAANGGFVDLSNASVLNVQAGAALVGGTWSATNSGRIDFASGVQFNRLDAHVVVSGDTSIILATEYHSQNDGTLELLEGRDWRMWFLSPFYTNNGTLHLSPGSVFNAYEEMYLTATSTLQLDVGSVDQGWIDGTMEVSLGGALEVAFLDNAASRVGEVITLIDAPSITGSFSSVALPDLGPGASILFSQTSQTVSIRIVAAAPVPGSSLALCLGGGIVALRRERRSGRASRRAMHYPENAANRGR